ncbi:MAG: hypothetical protein RLZZ480_235 [Candidatus Parcubacteria bacterium]|jgi:hypothetical protein
MSEVLQANIFFYIASVATVIFCIVVTMILFQIYKIMKTVRSILERIDSASEVMAEDVAHVRKLVATGGLVSTIVGLVFGTKKKKRSRTTEDDN